MFADLPEEHRRIADRLKAVLEAAGSAGLNPSAAGRKARTDTDTASTVLAWMVAHEFAHAVVKGSRTRYYARNVTPHRPARRTRVRRPMVNLDEDAIIAEYHRGDSPTVLGERHGVHLETIRRRLVARGVELRGRSTAMARRFHDHGDLAGLAEALGRTPEDVHALLVQFGFRYEQPRDGNAAR